MTPPTRLPPESISALETSTPTPELADRHIFMRVNELVANPVFAYAAIIALQVRVIWRIWDYADLTPGDTSSYFLTAISWTHGLHDNIVWSPLYTDFVGTILALFHDVPTAMMAHRVLIILVTCVLFLAVMRSLLGPGLGLLASVWWAVLPANYRVEYEVHLFGLIPVLVAILVLVQLKSRVLGRGIAFAVLLGTSLLLRNELAIATAVLGIAIVATEVRELRRDGFTSAYVRSRLRCYGIPLVVVALLFLGAYERSLIKGTAAREAFRAKQTLNFCQVYAFSYRQEHPSFPEDPWTGCSGLIERTFGRQSITIAEAAKANPGAVAHYVAWNLSLLPAGLQVSLFGATSGGKDPGFAPVEEHRDYALVLSAVAVLLLVTGAVLLIRRRRARGILLSERSLSAIVVLSGLALTTFYVALSERPRPDYLYGFVVCAVILLGVCASVVAERLGLGRFIAAVALLAWAFALIPSHYHPQARPLHDAVERLKVVQHRLQQPGAALLASGYNYEICSYLADAYNRSCTAPAWPDIQARLAAGASLEATLQDARIRVVYADPILENDPVLSRFLAAPRAAGWRYVSSGVAPDGKWGVLVPVEDSPTAGT
jgi:hypothetical protein